MSRQEQPVEDREWTEDAMQEYEQWVDSLESRYPLEREPMENE